jgi:hypothetical protein
VSRIRRTSSGLLSAYASDSLIAAWNASTSSGFSWMVGSRVKYVATVRSSIGSANG